MIKKKRQFSLQTAHGLFFKVPTREINRFRQSLPLQTPSSIVHQPCHKREKQERRHASRKCVHLGRLAIFQWLDFSHFLTTQRYFFTPFADVNLQRYWNSFCGSHTTQTRDATLWGSPLTEKLLRNNSNAVKNGFNLRPGRDGSFCLTEMYWVGVVILVGILFWEL